MTNGTRLTTADPARDLAAEAKVLQLQQENDCLREWKDSVSAAIQSFQEFAAGEWAGDKSGWGYHHCVITWAQRELTKLRGVIAQHDLCHDLHGKVGAVDFARGCAAEQRWLYGCAPDADEVVRLRDVLRDVVTAWDDASLEDTLRPGGVNWASVAARMSDRAERTLGNERDEQPHTDGT